MSFQAEFVMKTEAFVKGKKVEGSQVCEIRLTDEDVRNLFDLPQVKELLKTPRPSPE